MFWYWIENPFISNRNVGTNTKVGNKGYTFSRYLPDYFVNKIGLN